MYVWVHKHIVDKFDEKINNEISNRDNEIRDSWMKHRNQEPL